MRVALIQSIARADRNALSVARALRRQGHEATLVVPQFEGTPWTPAFVTEWRGEGFAWIPVNSARLEPPHHHFPKDRGLATARRLAELITAFDVAWFFERHWAMLSLRNRRFRDRLLPLIVLDAEPDPEPVPGSLEEINRAHSRNYALRWADLVCEEGEAEYSARKVHARWRERNGEPAREIRRPSTSPAVTVCIPYFEVPALLPETLRSLEQQTCGDFTVVVVDDGSRTEEGQRGFDACAERYAGRGWKFVRQTNLYPGAARNRAAREANTEFLTFLDSDDIAMPSMVERLLRAALLTGDDCLAVPIYTFLNEPTSRNKPAFLDEPEGPCILLYEPPGNSLVGSMADDMHGASGMIVRRQAFWSVGGFTEVRGVGFEDYEFHVRCNLEGLRWDVLPELIYRRRESPPGSVSRSTQRYANHERVRRWYEARLRRSGLGQLPLAVASAFWRDEQVSEREADLRAAIAARLPKLPPARQRLRLLLLTSGFPFGAHSGWHTRLQEMIRYFGSRYQLTLVTPAAAEGHWGFRREALRHLHALREVESGNRLTSGSDALPLGVRERCMQTMQSALRAMPAGRYHAALIDMIFMAEFRHDLETMAVLTEHNIESRLLRQAAATCGTGPLPDAERLEEYENRTWPDFPLRAVPSEVDRAQMDGRTNVGQTVLAPNGADLSRWLPKARHDTGVVLFPAHLGYFPNVDAVEFLVSQVWPQVRKHKPRARLMIAGRLPSDAVKSAVAGMPGVELRANPKSMDRVAARASITVAPLRLGSGTRVKILESMAWGLPVVSTTLGCEGIEAADGEHLLIRDDPREFAEAIVGLMSDRALWERLRNAGRELIRRRYSWDRVFEPLEDALIELVS